MSTLSLRPVSALDDAVAKAREAAKAALPLVGATLHAQFPDGAYLVLTRPEEYDSDEHDAVRLDSVRDADGNTLWEFDEHVLRQPQLPAVPDEIAALWGDLDPRDPAAVLELVQRIDAIAPYELLDFLPVEVCTVEETKAEELGERSLLGIPLAPAAD